MKTVPSPEFATLADKVLQERLLQLVREFQISYVFFEQTNSLTPSHLIIVTSKQKDILTIQSRKWIRCCNASANVLIHVTSQTRMDFELKAGNPFFSSYCRRSATLYQNQEAKDLEDFDRKLFKKRFTGFKNKYYHDRDILLSEAVRFQKVDSLTGLFMTYLSVFEFDVRYLEALHIGQCFVSDILHERIRRLARFFPEIEKLFVKKNGEEYYLILELEKAKEVGEFGDEIRLNEKLVNSVVEIENRLSELVSSRFKDLKTKLKADTARGTVTVVSESNGEDKELQEIVSQILSIRMVEEIYCFHRTTNHQSTTYFFLFVGEGLGREVLGRIQQSVQSKSEEKCELILIGHSRAWIQTNLYSYQSFFQKVMTLENLVFQSRNNLPAIHWENPHTPEYPDLEYYYLSATKLTEQYFALRKNSDNSNFEGLESLFSQSVTRMLRTFVFAGLSYLPNYLPARSLWHLCVYASPKLEKLEYLFEKLSGESFFKEVDYYRRFYHKLSRMTEEKLEVTDEILKSMKQYLETVCARLICIR
ncbi:hypothetical protein [Mangrovibacterium diazotrophicum]|uniref:Uncharacterized protein n=1 Tax=Mangrovibacterium diazotrophicum TaxID=1261403 RepID=A0A419WB48_9BACT|nr:hypothetical protein [Mangrovibacterium diazotrophicum]RKD92636.1 hypothetical protein BC643_3011 [Mangrovibacterium diazotrophicum]